MIEAKSVLTIDNNGKIFTLILSDFGFNYNFNFSLRISKFTLTSNLKLKLKFNPKYYLLNGENTSWFGLGSDLVSFVAYKRHLLVGSNPPCMRAGFWIERFATPEARSKWTAQRSK